ncbi:MAG TPA: Tad domain-containing protein [Gemmatimonadota bacterium]|nr:Tad domain-containing protein [Gemmatimonadota bacterium]
MSNVGEVRRQWKDRGSTLVLVAAAMVSLLGMVALAVDLGMLFTARSEAQRAADSAALAGAGHLMFNPNDEAGARSQAEQYGESNDIQGQQIDIDPQEDVEVDLAEERVRVTVHRDEVRGGPVATWFARVLGIDEVDVAAVAAAQLGPAGAAKCLKPFIIPDRWDDANANLYFDDGDYYAAFETGYGTAFANNDGMGYTNDFGREIEMKAGNAGGDSDEPAQPGWYYPFDIPQTEEGNCSGGPEGQGGQCYEWAIVNCHPHQYEIGDIVIKENGSMSGPTSHGVDSLVALDPDAYWDPIQGTVLDSDWGANWAASPRYGIILTFDPSLAYDPGKNELTITNIIGVWFEGVQGKGGPQQRVFGRVLWAAGLGTGDEEAPAIKRVQLVE